MKYTYRAISMILIIFTFFSCKKQEKEEGVNFGIVNFNDFAGDPNISLLYQGDLLGGTGLWKGQITTLPGEGKFTFIDKTTNVPLLDTILNIIPDQPKTYYVIKTSATAVQLLQNTQQSEPTARDGYVKVKIANFAKTALGSKIKIVFKQLDYETYDYVPVDTLENVTPQLLDTFTEIKKDRSAIDNDGNTYIDYNYVLTFLNENDEPILNTQGIPLYLDLMLITGSVYTLILTEDINPGTDPYLYIRIMFEN